MSYDCNDMPDWMRPVDTMQEHYDHEENARYDQYDGLRGEEFYDDCNDHGDCNDCHRLGSDCKVCAAIKAWNHKWDCIAEEHRKNLAVLMDDPTSTHYVPF